MLGFRPKTAARCPLTTIPFHRKPAPSGGRIGGRKSQPSEILPPRRTLTDRQCLLAKPKPKAWKLYDRDGLFLLIDPAGRKGWRVRFRFAERRRELSVGPYPQVTLVKAREACAAIRQQVRDGVHPLHAKRRAKREAAAGDRVTFTGVADEWLKLQPLAPRTLTKLKILLRLYLKPTIGAMPIATIEPADLLDALRAIEGRGLRETAHRTRQFASQVFRYAIVTGRAKRDPSGDLRGALRPVKTVHFPAVLDAGRLGGLLRAIDGYDGFATVKAALQMLPYVFVRPGELRSAEWAEFDVPAAVWRIPGAKMKMRQDHLVPLSRQVLAILEKLKPLTGQGRWLFPSTRTGPRSISDNTLNAALRRLGYTTKDVTAHGFRATARTLLDERLRVSPDIIELQLAHRVRGALGDTYARAQHWEQRVAMMQAWSDYLDTLKNGQV